MSPNYGWIITRDLFAEQDEAALKASANRTVAGLTFASRVGTLGPRGIAPEVEVALRNGVGFRFRMKDDDGELIYEGRYFGDPDGEEAFGPLDDFGMPDSGCTTIEYLSEAGKEVWIAL